MTLLIAAALLVLAALVPAARADQPRPDPQVAGLQVELRARGLYHAPIDGLEGPLTRAAVEALQRLSRHPATGRVDRTTLALVAPAGGRRYRSRQLRKGLRGLDVGALQFELGYHGFPVRETGFFVQATAAALIKFERFAGLRADAIAGPAVYRALAQPPPQPPALRPPLPVATHAVVVPGGVELPCAYGTPVAAAIAGTVAFAGTRGAGYGYTVVIRARSAVELLYAHLARVDVRVGQSLLAGAFVGLAGWTGKRRADTSLRVELTLRGAQLDTVAALAAADNAPASAARG